MAAFDWHSGTMTRDRAVDRNYRNTQMVRRFFRAQCGADFKFDRAFMAWLKDDTAKTLGEAADEWLRRQDPRPAETTRE